MARTFLRRLFPRRDGIEWRGFPALSLVALVTATAFLAPFSASSGRAAESVSTADGVYSKAQARSGAGLYEQHCLVCHDKKYFRPVLKRWQGQSASVLFDVMAGSMPESNPGGLLDAEYLDIMAYIFSRSRFPAADRMMTMADLPAITIEPPR